MLTRHCEEPSGGTAIEAALDCFASPAITEAGMILGDKVALVTGSTSGIGLAIAKALAAQGARLMINGFGDAADISRECETLGALHDGADMSKPVEVERMMKRCADELGSPDILVNNAGIQHVSPVEDFPPEKWDAIIAVNLSSAFHTTRHALPAMKAKRWGRIINTASAHSLVASPNKSAYVAAKHGIAGFTKTIALEAAKDGVTVNCISPGYVWTPLVEKQIPDTMATRGLTREQVMDDVLLAAQPTKRFMTPEEVAALVVFLCREDAASITGANLSMDGGWTAA
jgi:3-hydroxybutyrate dehydrogenase